MSIPEDDIERAESLLGTDYEDGDELLSLTEDMVRSHPDDWRGWFLRGAGEMQSYGSIDKACACWRWALSIADDEGRGEICRRVPGILTSCTYRGGGYFPVPEDVFSSDYLPLLALSEEMRDGCPDLLGAYIGRLTDMTVPGIQIEEMSDVVHGVLRAEVCNARTFSGIVRACDLFEMFAEKVHAVAGTEDTYPADRPMEFYGFLRSYIRNLCDNDPGALDAPFRPGYPYPGFERTDLYDASAVCSGLYKDVGGMREERERMFARYLDGCMDVVAGRVRMPPLMEVPAPAAPELPEPDREGGGPKPLEDVQIDYERVHRIGAMRMAPAVLLDKAELIDIASGHMTEDDACILRALVLQACSRRSVDRMFGSMLGSWETLFEDGDEEPMEEDNILAWMERVSGKGLGELCAKVHEAMVVPIAGRTPVRRCRSTLEFLPSDKQDFFCRVTEEVDAEILVDGHGIAVAFMDPGAHRYEAERAASAAGCPDPGNAEGYRPVMRSLDDILVTERQLGKGCRDALLAVSCLSEMALGAARLTIQRAMSDSDEEVPLHLAKAEGLLEDVSYCFLEMMDGKIIICTRGGGEAAFAALLSILKPEGLTPDLVDEMRK